MEIKQIMKIVNEFFNENVAPPHKITSLQTNEDEGWKVVVEVIEEREYMKKYAKDEMLGIYEAYLNKDKEITAFARKSIRYRSAVNIEE